MATIYQKYIDGIRNASEINFDTAGNAAFSDNCLAKVSAIISRQLQLSFLDDEPPPGHVCYAESAEVRDDFKIYFTRMNLLDYFYALSHAARFRMQDCAMEGWDGLAEDFWQLARLGERLRLIYSLDCPDIDKESVIFPVPGDNRVGDVRYTDGQVFINRTQYFSFFPAAPSSKESAGRIAVENWLRARQRMYLEAADISRLQKIIATMEGATKVIAAINDIIAKRIAE